MPRPTRESIGNVYVARLNNGNIKIGFSADVPKRMRQLDATLIASAPGSLAQEQDLIRACVEFRLKLPTIFPRTGPRETFLPAVEPTLAAAWGSMFGEELPALFRPEDVEALAAERAAS